MWKHEQGESHEQYTRISEKVAEEQDGNRQEEAGHREDHGREPCGPEELARIATAGEKAKEKNKILQERGHTLFYILTSN